VKDGGDTPPPTGGAAVEGALGGVGLEGAAPGPLVGWSGSAAVDATAGVVTDATVAIASGVRVGTTVGESVGSGMGCVAAARTGTGVVVAVGADVGVLGGTGVSVGARVGATVGTAEVGAGVGAAAGAAQAARAGKRRSAATTAHLNRVISTRYNFSFTCPPEIKMINTPHVLARLTLALVVMTLASCGAPAPAPPTASAPKAVATLAATLAPTSPAAPAPTLAPTKPFKPTDEPVEDFTPKAQSVWDTQVGPDSLKGCSGGSILPAYGLVQMTPEGNTLVWKNQEPKPYTMTRVKPGVYAYEGPTAINDGTVKMVATFSGPTTVKMTRSFTPKAEAACVHTHEYTGVFKWETAPAATPKP
jgi:hypothetical protein